MAHWCQRPLPTSPPSEPVMDAFVVGLGNPAPISKRKRMNHEGTRRSTKEDPTQDGFPLWNSCPSWFMPLREAAPGKGFRVFGRHDYANNCTAFCSCLLKPRYRCFELWYGACYRPGGIRQQELKAVSPNLDPG